jgi:ABC-type transport system involved in cytochrome bd biosynthesis fused ATPase/permease subunit
VLILDEPTAHLDPLAAEAFVADLLAAADGTSILLITHSPIGLAAFDEVLLLEGGRIAARGGHDELRASSERYRELMGLGPTVSLPHA